MVLFNCSTLYFDDDVQVDNFVDNIVQQSAIDIAQESASLSSVDEFIDSMLKKSVVELQSPAETKKANLAMRMKNKLRMVRQRIVGFVSKLVICGAKDIRDDCAQQ